MSRISKIFWIWIGLLITTLAMANDLAFFVSPADVF